MINRKMVLALSFVSTFQWTSCQTTRSKIASDSPPVDSPTDSCSEYRAPEDPILWLKEIRSQSTLNEIFRCARKPETTAEIPTGKGKGLGSLVAGPLAWNYLQVAVGSTIWGGKEFIRDESGVHLFNYMLDNNTHRYNAVVLVDAHSYYDQKSTILLDYSQDDSVTLFGLPRTPAQVIIDPIARGIRDEIREILNAAGTRTGVYIGRANLQNSCAFPIPLTERVCGKMGGDKYTFAANFFLDFRSQSTAGISQ